MWSVYTRRSTPEQKFSFSDLLALQDQVLATLRARASQSNEGALLFAEMHPTVTLGARQIHDEKQKPALDALRAYLNSQGVDLVAGERGGKETWHGPGQWVGFVVTPLQSFTGDARGVRKAVYTILHNVLEVVKAYQPEARIEEDARLGIWVPGGLRPGKVVSVGIKVRDGYVTSGFALNCYPTEKSFVGIHPCGLEGEKAAFLFQDRLASENWPAEFESLPAKLLTVFQKNQKMS